MTTVDRILAAISELPQRERRRLWRRARQMGLLDEELAPANKTPTTSSLQSVPRSVTRAAMRYQAQSISARRSSTATTATETASATLIFDGGSKGNPGQGYGSYLIEWNGEAQPVRRLTFGDDMTNNEAEYETLIAGLEDILGQLEAQGISPDQVTLDVRGDSRLVINQLAGEWQVREPRLQHRWERASTLLAHFGHVTLRHQPRVASIERLGH